MSQVDVTIGLVGQEKQPVATIDDFASDPDTLRAAAIATRFGAAGQHYPGIRAPLPADYLIDRRPSIGAVLREAFGHAGGFRVLDASFSIVTRHAAALSVRQRVPHCDAFGADRVALVHYLSPEGGDGTAFYRHRSTGFETITHDRAVTYSDCLDAELRDGASPPKGYITGDTPLFERTAMVDARYNRTLIYRSHMLHSGAISPDATLSPDPAAGRLTVTAFLVLE